MTRMYEDDSELAIIRAQQELNHLSVLCQWDWTMAGIRFSSTCQTLLEEHTEQITLKLSEYR